MHSQERKDLQTEDHAYQNLRMDDFFMISKMELNHTCDAPYKNRRKYHYMSNLVKSVILQDVQNHPLLKLEDIKCKFRLRYRDELLCIHRKTNGYERHIRR